MIVPGPYPQWLHQKPSYGVCGSLGVSQCWWWYRCEEAHSSGSPCTAMAPRYASVYSNHCS